MSYTASTCTTAGTPSTDTTTSTGKTAPARPALVRPALVRPALALLVPSPSRIWHELHCFYLHYRRHAQHHHHDQHWPYYYGPRGGFGMSYTSTFTTANAPQHRHHDQHRHDLYLQHWHSLQH